MRFLVFKIHLICRRSENTLEYRFLGTSKFEEGSHFSECVRASLPSLNLALSLQGERHHQTTTDIRLHPVLRPQCVGPMRNELVTSLVVRRHRPCRSLPLLELVICCCCETATECSKRDEVTGSCGVASSETEAARDDGFPAVTASDPAVASRQERQPVPPAYTISVVFNRVLLNPRVRERPSGFRW